MTSVQHAEDHLREARAAFSRGDWEAAKRLYEAVLERDPESPDALDGLGQSLWWLGESRAAIELRARAFAAYRRRGDVERAGLVATYLAGEYRIAGNSSLGAGWLGRAQRLLEDVGHCPALGWLEIELCKRAPTPEIEERHGRRALELARDIGDCDLEAAALGHVGLALVSAGRVPEGVRLLDEAIAVAVAGEAEDPLAIGEACCITLVACDQLSDARRARDFGRAVSDFARRRNYLPLAAWCRAVYAQFLVASGRWKEAERELQAALEEFRRLADADPLTAIVCLAELRIRQGRHEEAAQLLAGSENRQAAVATAVRLDLACGRPKLAAQRLEQRLDGAGDGMAADAPLFALRPAVELALGRADAAAEAAAALDRLAQRLQRDDLMALAAVQHEQAAPSAGEDADARRLEWAADEGAALLRRLGAPGRAAPRVRGELTRREREVLGLLAAGLSNPEIAERLVISPKTAEHHVSRVLAKLGVRNRAEAAAYAARARPDGGTL